jgi:hypothetical protein
MPRKSVRKHGSQEGQQTKTETYKSIKNYKNLKIKEDDISSKLELIYNDNIWDLKSKFEDLKEYYEQLGISDIIAWNEEIQYLDTVNAVAIKQTSIQAFKRGDYRSIATDKPNLIITEKKYADRILFYIKTFEPFKQFQAYDDFSWVLTYNRLLLYEILNYHNQKKNQLITVNGDVKTMIRAIKLILQNPEDEIRWKYSALQIALGDVDRLKDDLNKITSVNELKSFIPYENLLDIVDYLEIKYNDAIAKLPTDIKTNFRKHPDNVVFLNQVLVAVAINVLDYPSRLDKFEMDIIVDEDEIQPNKCYVLLTNPISFVFNNDKKNHKPIKYKLNAKPILGLNKRLNDILYDSITKYPRNSLFIKKDSWSSQTLTRVGASTVSEWIRNIVSNKTLNIGTFRSSFVSYYYPKSNNLDKKIMVNRMRTSIDEINRAYLKFYNTPEALAQVKVEPSQDLLNRANSGKENNPIIINNNKQSVQIKQEPLDNVEIDNSIYNKAVNIQDKRKEIAKKWYENPDNKERHKMKVRENSRKPSTYRNRYIRDLNSGVMDITKMKQETIDKFDIKRNDIGVYY